MNFDLDFLDRYGTVISAVITAFGVKLMDGLLARRSESSMESAQIRDELRKEVADLRKELTDWRSEADEWRDRYYREVESSLSLKTELEQLRNEFETLKKQIAMQSGDGTTLR